MVSVLRRSLKNDTTRSGIYLVVGVLLFLGAGQTFVTAVTKARDFQYTSALLPGTQTPATPPERYLAPAPVEYPFF